MHDARRRFEEEILPHAPSVYATARRLAGQDADARDLVQETFLRAFRTFAGYTPGTNARAWLLTILHSIFINRHHRDRRAPDRISDAEHSTRVHHEPAAPRPPKVAAETAARVEAALAALPEAFRAAVVLVDLEELTYEEAATVAGCPIGTLRSRLFRARRQLADALQDYSRRRDAGKESSR